jgi:uncharacterized membrane protein AbrB (regulator of aidB expression)
MNHTNRLLVKWCHRFVYGSSVLVVLLWAVWRFIWHEQPAVFEKPWPLWAKVGIVVLGVFLYPYYIKSVREQIKTVWLFWVWVTLFTCVLIVCVAYWFL